MLYFSYIRDERLLHLLSYITQYLQTSKRYQYYGYDDEVFLV